MEQLNQKIVSVSYTDVCYERLKNDILTNKLRWGDKVDIALIADAYGVSRSPVVRAVERLALEGFIEILPYKGSFVRRPTFRDVIEVTELRIAYEMMACELAFKKNRRALIADISKLQDEYDQREMQEPEIPVEEFLDYDRHFHRIVMEKAENQRMLDRYLVVRNQIEVYRVKTHSVGRAVELHRRFVAKLNQEDLGAALSVLRLHLEEVGQEILQTI
jgi:DNA-binding GntR family transcriptional regulator